MTNRVVVQRWLEKIRTYLDFLTGIVRGYDRMEFVSIGGLVAGLSMDGILLGVSQARNEKLAAVFYRLKLIEAYGTGIPKIMASYKESRLAPRLAES